MWSASVPVCLSAWEEGGREKGRKRERYGCDPTQSALWEWQVELYEDYPYGGTDSGLLIKKGRLICPQADTKNKIS
jgi:hypothetical protein